MLSQVYKRMASCLCCSTSSKLKQAPNVFCMRPSPHNSSPSSTAPHPTYWHYASRQRLSSAHLLQTAAKTMATITAPSHISASAPEKPVIRGVVFDMDGTLTVPVFDFALMRQRVGVPQGTDILDAIKMWPKDKQDAAIAIIREMEDQALQDMKLMPGLIELCSVLDQAGVPRGLITRNVKSSIDYFHKHHFPLNPFLPSISRECAFAYKPSPDALLHICQTWGISPNECIMVGDSVKDDIVCGNRAGSFTILLDFQGQNGHAVQPYHGELRPHFVAHSLHEVASLLQSEFQLLTPPKPAADLIEDVASEASAAGGR